MRRVIGTGLVQVLERLYLHDLSELMKNYKALEALDASLLAELDVNLDGLKEALRLKIQGLKDLYWKKLFDNLDDITSRLTHQSRQEMLDHLTTHTHLDFSVGNAYAVPVWVLKNANAYYDEQLIGLVEQMTEAGNIKLYKSNIQRSARKIGDIDKHRRNWPRYSLELRCVLHHIGGMKLPRYNFDTQVYKELSESARHFLDDIMTIANNIGFDTAGSLRAARIEWEAGNNVSLYFYDHRSSKEVELMTVRAFKNGNMLIKFNKAFMRRLNIEFGRLKGWVRDWSKAVEELNVSKQEAQAAFGANIQLKHSSLLQICSVQNAA